MALLLAAPCLGQAQRTLVAQESTWRFLDDGSNQGTAWRQAEFDDSSWRQGAGQLGFGEGDESTAVRCVAGQAIDAPCPAGGDRIVTTYFRRQVTVATPGKIMSLMLELLHDDGAVLYVNGVEAARVNMPSGSITFGTLASSAVAPENTYVLHRLRPFHFRAGENTLAVEVHQASATSSDLSFDLGLSALDNDITCVPAAEALAGEAKPLSRPLSDLGGAPQPATLPDTLLVVPFFEVDVNDPTGSTTLLAVRNVSANATTPTLNVRPVGYFPSLVQGVSAPPGVTRTINLRDFLAGGTPPASPDGIKRGSIVIAATEKIVGDFLLVDPAGGFATGNGMFSFAERCDEVQVRFFDFGSGTRIGIWVNAQTPDFTVRVFDEPGNPLGAFDCTSSGPTAYLLVQSSLFTDRRFGVLELDLSRSGGGFVYGDYSAFGTFSAGVEGACTKRRP